MPSEILICHCHSHKRIWYLMRSRETLHEFEDTSIPKYGLPDYIPLKATWFGVIDSDLFSSLAEKFPLKTYNYVDANTLDKDPFRIIHACDDCIEEVREIVPSDVIMDHYPAGFELEYKRRGKDKRVYQFPL